jgi:hypothetical protein
MKRWPLILNDLHGAGIDGLIPVAVCHIAVAATRILWEKFSAVVAWGRVMREYHFYFLDQHSQIKSTKIAQCADDLARWTLRSN